MGAWGHQSFQNDDALDWLTSLEDAEDLDILEEAFDAIPSEADEYVEADEASAALAAAEVVAASLGKPAAEMPDEVESWLKDKGKAKSSLAKKAQSAVKRILANSELKELWEESDDFAKWKDDVTGLLKRLSG